ncbi:hypothetical protein R75461_07930 [Paraburkholderia nemoris]|nr:hypothetical protein R75461_07930 [Paraburkholderia nemoris]
MPALSRMYVSAPVSQRAGVAQVSMEETWSKSLKRSIGAKRSFYDLMHSVLMQPDWICISPDEFIDVDAINSLWPPNSHLFAIQKYKHELPFPFLFRGLLSR